MDIEDPFFSSSCLVSRICQVMTKGEHSSFHETVWNHSNSFCEGIYGVLSEISSSSSSFEPYCVCRMAWGFGRFGPNCHWRLNTPSNNWYNSTACWCRKSSFSVCSRTNFWGWWKEIKTSISFSGIQSNCWKSCFVVSSFRRYIFTI